MSAAGQAIRGANPGDPHLATYVDIATGLVAEVASLGDRWPDVDDAIRICRATAATLDPADPRHIQLLAAIQRLLLTKAQRHPDAVTIDECIAAGRSLLQRVPDDALRASVLADIAFAVRMRYHAFGDLAALDEAIRTAETAVAIAPENEDGRPNWLSNLSNSLRLRYERLGTLDDLDRAVQAARRAVDEAATDHPTRAKILSNLALALRLRYEHVGEPRDLDRAVETGRQAIEAVVADHPDQPMLLSNHSIALRARFDAFGQHQDLDEAVDAARTAVVRSEPHDDHRPGRLTNISALLVTRFLRSGTAEDLDEAIATARESVSATAADDPRLPLLLSNLGAALARRDEPEEAAQHLQRAIQLSPADHPDRAKYASSFAGVLTGRARHDDAVAEEVLGAWRDAAGSAAAAVSVRLSAAHARAKFAAESGNRWRVASEGYAQAAELLPLLVWRGLERTSREALLGRWSGLPQDAAAAATECGDLESALQSMEQSRAVLWTQLLDVRTDLQALHRAAPALAGELARVRAGLAILDDRLGVSRAP